VIRVYDEAGNVIETHEHKGDFKEVVKPSVQSASSTIPQGGEKCRHFLAIPDKLGARKVRL
jgi:hypothetical protein